MAITALLELRFKPDALDEARTVLGAALAETRDFDGNLGVDVLVDVDDPAHWIAHETWESKAHDDAYRAFRAGAGAIKGLGPLLAAAPVLTWLEADTSI